jgi:predicted glycosyltransferase
MRALFDLLHPAHVRFFGYLIEGLRADGHEVMVVSRDKDETEELLDGFGIPHETPFPRRRGPAGMALELVGRTWRILQLARRFRPHVLVAKSEVSLGVVGRILGIPHVMFDDTEFAWLQIRLSQPFATVICTGMGYSRSFGRKQIRYNAPPQLAHTHPDHFRPDPDVPRRHGLEEPFVVLRLKDWNAMHDIGVSGYRPEERARLVRSLSEHGRPIISSEGPLPESLADYGHAIPSLEILHLLAFARLYVGEGASMAAEAACLGTPAVFLSPRSRRGYLDAMEERFGHVATVHTVPEAVARAQAFLSGALRERGAEARQRLVAECVDPVRFMRKVLERYALKRG